MLGYRIYFDGSRFVADDIATEVQTMPADSTTMWFVYKKSAEDIVELRNANDLKDVKKCKECGEYFWQRDEERAWFADRNMKPPRRCYSCRKKKIIRKIEPGCFKVGDRIYIGKRYTATCQEVEKNGAIFMFDQYLDEVMVMNQQKTNDGGYRASDLRMFLQWLARRSMFDDIREMMIPFKTSGDLLRIPTAEEIFGPEKAHKYYEILSFEKQWPLMKDRRNRIAFCEEKQEIVLGWLQNKHKNTADIFACMDGNGNLGLNVASCLSGVRVVFRLFI